MTTTIATTTGPVFAMVPFLDTEILAAKDGDVVRIPMRRFCESVGVEWPAQRRRITRDDMLREGVVMMTTPSEGGDQEQITLPLAVMPGFLFGMDARRFAPALQDRVRAFRAECYAVLYAHFARRDPAPLVPVVPPPAAIGWEERDALRRAGPQLVALITAETRPSVRRYLHALLDEDCRRLGLATPPLDELGREIGPDGAIAALLEGCRMLSARRVKWNHAALRGGDWRRAAVNLTELAELFARADIDVAIDGELRDALRSCATHRVHERTMTSAITGRLVRCTVIEPLSCAA